MCPHTASIQPRAQTHRVLTGRARNVASQPATPVASQEVVSKQGMARSRDVWEPCGVAGRGIRTLHHLLAHVASGSHVAPPDVLSKRGVICSGAVREPCGVTGLGVRTLRHLPTWCHRVPRGVAACGVVTCMASLARGVIKTHVVTGSGAATRRQTLRLGQGATRCDWRSRHWPHLAPQDVASELCSSFDCSRGFREPHGVAGRGVRTWRQAPSTHVALVRGVKGLGASRHVSSECVLSVGQYVHPAGDPPEQKKL